MNTLLSFLIVLILRLRLCSSQCGIPKSPSPSLIIGGRTASVGQVPWIAILDKYAPVPGLSFNLVYCGGILVSAKYVLTAAHCMDDSRPSQVILGMYTVGTTDKTLLSKLQYIPIENIHLHEKYVKTDVSAQNDIASIKLKSPAQFTDAVIPICLPFIKYGTRTFENDIVTLAGWGRIIQTPQKEPKTLQILNQRVKPNSECIKTIPSITPIQMCAGGTKGKDSCSGDSGGSVTWQAPTKEQYLVGIISTGSPTCAVGIPDTFTRVTSFGPWVTKNTA